MPTVVTVTGLTAERMKQIEQASVVSGRISGDNLILTTEGGEEIVAGNVRGTQGPTGPTGISLWLTTQVLTKDITENIITEAVPDKNLQVGDLVMSIDPTSLGYFGKVVALSTRTNATIAYVGSLRGATGGSQEEFDNMYSVAMRGWVNNTTSSQAEVDTGSENTGRLISPAVLKNSILKRITGSATAVVSSIGQQLNRAADAATARGIIGAASAETTNQALARKPDSDEIDIFKPLTLAQYNNLAKKDPRTIYFVEG